MLAVTPGLAGISFKELADETARVHRSIFRRVSLHLEETGQALKPTDQRLDEFRSGANDPSLVAYFQYGRYLLISCSRPGSQPANLQGIWNDSVDPPWGSKFTININTQMNYWPAEPTNMPEMVEPLIAMIRDIAEAGATTARVMYGARGWVCHHNTDLWRATAPIELPKFGMWPTGGAWLCLHLWDRYEYSSDEQFLASVYPILKAACQFFLDTLVEDSRTGYIVTNPSMSPENLHGRGSTSICAGPTMDMQILRDLFLNTIRASEILGLDLELRSEIAAMRESIRPTRVGGGGQVMEWQDDWDSVAPDPYRHTSHLYGLYPSNQITVDATPDLAEAARVTLESRGDEGPGWSTAWRVSLWARLRDGQRAFSMLLRLLSAELCFSNLFDAHPPLAPGWISVFQIDGNLGGTSGIAEMIVQSTSDEVLLLPALPAQLASGRLSGILVRGGWSVAVEWKRGRLESVPVSARHNGTKTIRYRGIKAVQWRSRRQRRFLFMVKGWGCEVVKWGICD